MGLCFGVYFEVCFGLGDVFDVCVVMRSLLLLRDYVFVMW